MWQNLLDISDLITLYTLSVMIIWIAFVWAGGHPNDGRKGKSQQSRKWKRCANPVMKDTQWTILVGTERSKHIWRITLNTGCIMWRPETKNTTQNPTVEDRYFSKVSTSPCPLLSRIFLKTCREKSRKAF